MFEFYLRSFRPLLRTFATKSKNRQKKDRRNFNIKSIVTDIEVEPKQSNLQYLDEHNQYDHLRRTVTPLADLTYEEQLEHKTQKVNNIMKQFQKLLIDNKARISYAQGPFPCPVDFIKPSPVIKSYRSKDEFSLGPGIAGDVTAGFFIGRPKYGMVSVRPKGLVHMKYPHIKLAELYEKFVNTSKFPVCYKFHEGGHWRGITVRSNQRGDLMATVLFHPQDLEESQIEEAKFEIHQYFLNGEGKEGQLKSLFFQGCRHTKCTREQARFELLFGEPYLYETINGLEFRISPDVSFPQNKDSFKIFYETVKEVSGLSRATTVLDICCGTGTIGLLLAGSAKRVIGMDAVSGAIEDAKANAKLNSIENAEFHCGDLPNVMSEVLESINPNDDIVAVINPGRSGLPSSMINKIRSATVIDRVVYISCKPMGNSMDNFLKLCTSENRQLNERRFTPSLAVPIDSLPHTDHIELVLMFER